MQTPTPPIRYYSPITPVTGAAHQQPSTQATLSAWYFDRNCEYQYTGFIDAPDLIARGATRALDMQGLTLGLTLGIAHVQRDGVLA